ncbi:MAG: YqjF family protein [Gemmatimonadaceae bacterium]
MTAPRAGAPADLPAHDPPALTAAWLDLAILNYTVPPDALRPYVPNGTEIDAFRGTTYVSVVGFRFADTRVFGVRIPGHVTFDEVNLRFYVRRAAPEGWRRGVVFIRELVPRRAIAWVARAWYNEPYRTLPMRHDITRRPDGWPVSARYQWRRGGRWEGLSARSDHEPAVLAAGSEEEFIAEHYWGYTRQRDGSTIEYRVAHPRWRAAPATEARLDADVRALYGAPFDTLLGREPRSAFVADGSPVTVYRPATLR